MAWIPGHIKIKMDYLTIMLDQRLNDSERNVCGLFGLQSKLNHDLELLDWSIWGADFPVVPCFESICAEPT